MMLEVFVGDAVSELLVITVLWVVVYIYVALL